MKTKSLFSVTFFSTLLIGGSAIAQETADAPATPPPVPTEQQPVAVETTAPAKAPVDVKSDVAPAAQAPATPSVVPAAEQPINPDEVNAMATPQLTPGEIVESARDEFLKKNKISLGGPDAKGRFYYFATESVTGHTSNPQWGKLRVNAYEKAVMRAQTAFLRDMYGKQMIEMQRTYFHDSSDGNDEFPEEKSNAANSTGGAILKKAAALTEANLDKALQEAGVDPSEYSKKPLEQKRLLFRDQLIKRSMTRALGSVAGMTTIQTFSGTDGKGNYSVGVLMAYTPAMRQLAYDIAHRHTPKLTGSPRQPISEIIAKDPAILSETIGARIAFDENGRPCIISYGQWSHNYTGNDVRRLERSRASAERAALTQADGYITLFQGANMAFTDESLAGETTEQIVIKDRDGNLREEDVTKVIDVINEKTKVTAKADMLGRTTYDKRTVKDSSGSEIVCVIRVWTPQNLEAAKNIRDWKPGQKTAPAASGKTDSQTPPPAGSKQGQAIDLDNDF